MKVKDSQYDRLIVENSYRNAALCQFAADLKDKGDYPGIIFVRKRRHAQLLADGLSELLGRQVPAVTSQMSKTAREEFAAAMRSRSPEHALAVATAVWSTGLDIPALAWVMMAGAGQAPVGLKQSGGRPTRLEADKAGYVIYDVQDVGPGLAWAQEQSQLRLAHYAAAGFSVGLARLQAEELEDEDARELAELLAAGASQVAGAVVRPEELPAEDDWTARATQRFAALYLLICLGGLACIIAAGVRSCLSP